MRRIPRLNAPLLPLTVCLMAGIVVGQLLAPALLAGLLLGAVLLALLLGRWPIAQSIALWGCFLLLGMLVAPGSEERMPDGVWTEAVVASVPAERPKTVMVELLLPETGEQRRCYVWKDGRSLQLTVGQELEVCLRDSQFVGRDGWRIGGDGFNRLTHLQRLRIRALQWRGSLAAKFRTMEGDEDAHAVLAAMALGDKSALTRELRDTYSVSGASHVLALSGLHLSIVYLLLTQLTLRRWRYCLTQGVIVLCIWAFALLTGLSTSIVRAATMLTVYSLFSLGGRRHAPLGTLSFTAMLMLLTDSRLLFDVGFQLSFMAMLGILLFHPLFERMVSAKWMMTHRPVKWLYGLTSVSVSAQLGTAPLIAYYFGRFSTWFLLTNFIVIPLTTLILYGALLVLVIPAWGSILLWIVGMMNRALGWISALPLASIDGLHPSVLQVAMLYVLIAIFYLLLALQSPRERVRVRDI